MDNEQVGTVHFEWNLDMDSIRFSNYRMAGGPRREFLLKGRCQKCWGFAVGRVDASDACTGIKCRVCGTILEGEEAAEEYSRIEKEARSNALNMYFGDEPKYSEGTFVFKIFEPVSPIEEGEFLERIARSNAKQNNRERKLTRNEFPVGSPGMLMLQAKLLMDGLSRVSGPGRSVVEFHPVHFSDDGTLIVSMPREELMGDPYYWENRLRGNMGSTMVESLISAFACELAMKAISLTCKDEALKEHDLKDLFDALPQESQKRIRSDFPDIEYSLSQYRQTFDKWRYFEIAAGEEALKIMIDTDRSQKLAKAARVILDEASVVGLGGSVDVEAVRKGHSEDSATTYTDNIQVSVTGGERPPAAL